MKQLIQDVKEGNLEARHQLYRILERDKRAKAAIHRLSYEHSVLDRDDVRGEFWRGVALGMEVVKHDIGDPVLHLIQRGVWQVMSVVKHELRSRVMQSCLACGRNNSEYSYSRTCNVCTGPVENTGRYMDIADHDFAVEYLDNVSKVTSVSVTGPISTQQKRILEVLIQCCLQGSQHPASDASRILGICRERVRQHIAKLQPKVYLTPA